MSQDIVAKLSDLIRHAEEERPHRYYVKSVCEEAKKEIVNLRHRLRQIGIAVNWK